MFVLVVFVLVVIVLMDQGGKEHVKTGQRAPSSRLARTLLSLRKGKNLNVLWITIFVLPLAAAAFALVSASAASRPPESLPPHRQAVNPQCRRRIRLFTSRLFTRQLAGI